MAKPDGFGIDWLGRGMTWSQVERNIASGVYGANARQIELFVKDNKGFGTSDVLNENELVMLKSLCSGVAPEVPTIQGRSIFVKKYMHLEMSVLNSKNLMVQNLLNMMQEFGGEHS